MPTSIISKSLVCSRAEYSFISVLRQLRSGYTQRPRAFPHALCLIGLRDIRDYRIYSDASKRYIIGGSAFNIKEKSIRLADFTFTQVQELYAVHTDATGQVFAGERFALELKRRSKNVLTQGKQQLADYLKRLSLPNGWLIIFHRGKVTNWDEVGKREWVSEAGKQIEVIWL